MVPERRLPARLKVSVEYTIVKTRVSTYFVERNVHLDKEQSELTQAGHQANLLRNASLQLIVLKREKVHGSQVSKGRGNRTGELVIIQVQRFLQTRIETVIVSSFSNIAVMR